MKNKTYYGYANWATWNAFNWMSSYENSYRYFTEMAEELNCDIFEMSAREYLSNIEDFTDEDIKNINFKEVYEALKGGE